MLLQGQQLRIRQAALAAQAGEFDAAKRILEDELAFHRAVLARSDSLIAKLVTVRVVEQNMRARIALRARFPDLAFEDSISRLKPMERSLVRAIQLDSLAAREFLYELDGGLIDLVIEDRFYQVLFRTLPLKINATANLVMRPYIETAKASLLEPADFLRWAEQYQPAPATLFQWVYNGAGAALLTDGLPDYRTYIARMHDLDVLLVLTQVAEILMNESIDAGSVDAKLIALPQSYRNPLSGEPASWENGVLSFDYEPEKWRRTVPQLRLPLRTSD